MKSMRGILLTLCTTLTGALLAQSAMAQVDGTNLTIEPWGGYANFAKNVNLKDAPIYGGTFGVYFYRYIGLEGHLGWASSKTFQGFTPYAITPPASPTTRNLGMFHYGVDLALNLRPSAWFDPYVLGGWQEARITYGNRDSVPNPRFLNGIEFGGGVKLRLASRVAIRAEIRDAMWKFPTGTPPPAGTDGTDNQFYTAGIEFALGGKSASADADMDGVPDRRDNCPNTPAGAHVDARGCPTDADGDGVWDGIDQCPNTPTGATVDAKGCPNDADHDGVLDGIDQCADTPANAVVDARGCPKDSDNDGVPDGIDQCADTPAGAKVDARGCPVVTDADNDGVPDDKDLCPFTPANVKVDKDGCPIELNEKETQLLDKGTITERNIHFVTAKWDLLPESLPVLDEIGSILIQWPQLRIEVGGHCDARGSDAYNLDLSEKRANSVLEYLVGKFPQITREQYTAKGYGESTPVATNKTVEGMAMNRRVEFKVMNVEVLKKEQERRRTILKGE